MPPEKETGPGARHAREARKGMPDFRSDVPTRIVPSNKQARQRRWSAVALHTHQRRARLRHLTRRLHQLGEFPLYHFPLELDAGAPLIERLEAYCRLDPVVVRQLGADRMPLIKVIEGGRRE